MARLILLDSNPKGAPMRSSLLVQVIYLLSVLNEQTAETVHFIFFGDGCLNGWHHLTTPCSIAHLGVVAGTP